MSIFRSLWCSHSIWATFTCFLIIGEGLAEGYCLASINRLKAFRTPETLSFPLDRSENYPNNCQRQWRITGTTGRVNLQIKELDMENSTNCRYDALTIYSGSTNSENPVVKLCGTIWGYNLTITGNSVTLVFTSDSSIASKGFELTYAQGNVGMVMDLTATDDYQYLVYLPPGGYPNYADVKWRITSSIPRQKVTLDVTVLDIEHENSCDYDALTIHDGYNSSASVLKTICGQLYYSYRAVTSTSQYLYLHFTSDETTKGRGFMLRYINIYRPTVSSCNSNIGLYLDATYYPKELTSPNYPEPYPADCTLDLVIYSFYQKRVRFLVHHLDIEYQLNCSFDSLTFYDGYDASGKMLKRLCGRIIDGRLMFSSSSSYVYIRFVSNRRREYSGFRISYIGADSTPEEEDDNKSSSNRRARLVAGITGGVCALIFLVIIMFAVLRKRQCQRQQRQRLQQQQGLDSLSANPTTTINATPGSPSPGVYVVNTSAPPPSYATLNHAYVYEEAPPSYYEAHLFITDPNAPPLYSNAMMRNATVAQTSPATLCGANDMVTTKEEDDRIYNNELAQVTRLSQVPKPDQEPQPHYEHHPSDEQPPGHLGQEHRQES